MPQPPVVLMGVTPARRVGTAAALVVSLLGCVVLLGWHTHSQTLVQVLPGFVPMQYNAALGFLLCGVSLLWVDGQGRWAVAGVVAGWLATLIGALTLAQYGLSISLGIDQLLMEHYITVKTSHPGRMAPNTALCFTLTGAALAGHRRARTPGQRGATALIASVVTGLGTIALLGYVSQIETAYGWGNLTRMAVHTALGFTVMGAGLLAVGWHASEGEIPVWLPAPIGIGVATAALALWQALTATRQFGSIVPEVTLVAGLAIALLLAALTRLAQVARRSARQLAIRAEELERTNEELARYNYLASHDLQEPLRMVTGYCQLLQRRYGEVLAGEGAEFLDFILEGSERMHRQINDLLAYSRLSSEAPTPEPTDMGDALQSVLAECDDEVTNSGARVEAGALPTVHIDPERLRQLLRHLVVNALKYRGSEAPQVRIEAEAHDGEWVVAVADNGIGLDPEYAERVFIPFQRLHTRDTYPGTGMGLAICRRIVEQCGGRIWVESSPGEGATVRFSLPEHEAAA